MNHSSHLRSSVMLGLAALSLMPCAACRSKPLATADTAVAATSTAVAATSAAVAATSAAASSAPQAVECRANNEGGLIELTLTWDRNTAQGALSVDGKSRPVIAELYKGLVLVDAPGTTLVTGKVATVTTDGPKTIRLGDYKGPSFDCR